MTWDGCTGGHKGRLSILKKLQNSSLFNVQGALCSMRMLSAGFWENRPHFPTNPVIIRVGRSHKS